jgi:hypothetical protein
MMMMMMMMMMMTLLFCFLTQKARDPLTLSYMALAQVRFGQLDLANNTLNALLAMQDPAGPAGS